MFNNNDRSPNLLLHADAAYAGDERAVRAGLVSVIIPTYNNADTIERTISSVTRQTYPDLEALVVDDGSTDDTAAKVDRMAQADSRITLLQKVNGGLVSARNHGIAHARGEFIAPLDADDVWHSEKLAKQLAVIEAGGDEVGVVYCWSRAIDEHDRVLFFDLAPCMLRGNVYTALIMRNFFASGAPLVRRRCVDEVGGYGGITCVSRACEDFKFNLDIAERYDFDLVPEFLMAYRCHAGSMSTNFDAMMQSHSGVLEYVRARHPELPERLFRWAKAHQNREFGLALVSKGHLRAGLRLFLRAVREDPLATLRVGVIRIVARLLRFMKLAEPGGRPRGSRPGHSVVARNFFEVDPKSICGGRRRAPWTRRRLGYVVGLSVRRRAQLTSGIHGAAVKQALEPVNTVSP